MVQYKNTPKLANKMKAKLSMGNGVLYTFAPFNIKCIWCNKPFI